MPNEEKKVSNWEEEFEDTFIPDNKVGDFSMPRYLSIMDGIKSFITSLIESERAKAREEAIRECMGVVQNEKEGWYEAGEGLDVEHSAREQKDATLKSLTNLLTNK